MRLAALALAAASLGAAGLPAQAAPPTPDDEAIRAVEARQEAAWNAHDASAYARLFAEDADVVNVLGWWWKTRLETEIKLRRAFASVFASSNLHVEQVFVRSLSDDTAVAHVLWSMTGALSPDGSGGNIPQRGVQTQVLKRTGGSWLIVAFQNTNSVPERPFPVVPTTGR